MSASAVAAIQSNGKLWKWRYYGILAVATGLAVCSIWFGFRLVATVGVDLDDPGAASADSSLLPSIKRRPRNDISSSPANNHASSMVIQSSNSAAAAADNSKHQQLDILFMFTNVYRDPKLQRQFTICLSARSY